MEGREGREREAMEALLLKRSFDEFSNAAERMQEAFAGLEEKFDRINRELEEKNLELERVVREKERIKSYLEAILENLSNGIVVTDSEGRIGLMNGSAELFSRLCGGAGNAPKRDEATMAALFPALWQNGGIACDAVSQGTRFRIGGRILEVSSSAMAGEDRNTRHEIFVIRDVTRLARLEEMEKRTEKFAALEDMAATMAHEIRNPLGSIELFASLIMKEPVSERTPNRAYEIIKSVNQVNNRISNLLLFSRRPIPVIETIALHELIDEVLSFAGPIMENERIGLSKDYDGDVPWIRGDMEMLKQVLLNLVLNALQAMPDGGDLVLQTRMLPRDGIGGERAAGDVELLVADTGEGIVPEAMARIFDPFFTTREGGVGLGLSIVHTIIDMHGGVVSADRREEGGTVMTITLPLVIPPPGKQAEPAMDSLQERRRL